MLKKSLLLCVPMLIGQLSFTQVIETVADTSAILTVVDEDPDFNGGYDALTSYILTNINIISNEKKKKSESSEELLEGGRVIVRFVIEENGTISNIVLEERLQKCEPCNKEAIRIVKNMPKWKPAHNQGKAVRCYVRLPIRFEVD